MSARNFCFCCRLGPSGIMAEKPSADKASLAERLEKLKMSSEQVPVHKQYLSWFSVSRLLRPYMVSSLSLGTCFLHLWAKQQLGVSEGHDVHDVWMVQMRPVPLAGASAMFLKALAA